MSFTIDDLKGKRVSGNVASQITGADRRTINKYLEDLESIPGKFGGKEYDIVDMIRAMIGASKGQSSADRRNDAQARKLELEAGIIEKNYIPVGQVAAPVRAYVGAMNRVIQDSDLEDDRKERMAEKMKDCFGEVEGFTGRKIEE